MVSVVDYMVTPRVLQLNLLVGNARAYASPNLSDGCKSTPPSPTIRSFSNALTSIVSKYFVLLPFHATQLNALLS